MSNEKRRELIVAFSRKLDDGSNEARLILEFLRGFCYANRSTIDPNCHNMGANEGRRQVYVKIEHFIEEGKRL